VHEGLPLDFAFAEPSYWDGGRSDDDFLSSDLCVWTDDGGERSYFIRGVLLLPILGRDEHFAYGVWGSLSAESFEAALAHWDDPERVDDPPYFSWLSNSIPGYPETLNLPANVLTRALDLRPAIELLADVDHPLAEEQRAGISVARAEELAGMLLHA
jgi:hypothetical protein